MIFRIVDIPKRRTYLWLQCSREDFDLVIDFFLVLRFIHVPQTRIHRQRQSRRPVLRDFRTTPVNKKFMSRQIFRSDIMHTNCIAFGLRRTRHSVVHRCRHQTYQLTKLWSLCEFKNVTLARNGFFLGWHGNRTQIRSFGGRLFWSWCRQTLRFCG